MTVLTTSSQIVVSGNGVQTVFEFPFIGVAASDIEVVYTDSSGAETTLPTYSYLVAPNAPVTGQIWGVGGTVTYPLSGSPIASGTSLTITRLLPLTQSAEISNQGNQYPLVTEQALDILCMQIQQVSARTGKIRGTWLTGTVYNYSDIVVDGENGNNTGNLYSCALPNTSGTWSTDLANGDWSLALNVQAITTALPTISNNQVFGNISGSTAAPTGIGVSSLIDSAIGSTQGSILYRSGSAWVLLAPGTNGQILQTQGTGANPQWATASGTGTVTSIATASGITGGPLTTSGTIALAAIADASLLANLSGGSLAPSATTLSALLDYVLGNTQGSVIYRGGSLWSLLTPGTSGQVLTTGGASSNPSWTSKSFGSWSANAFSVNTVYTAATDGFVIAWGTQGGGGENGSLQGLTNGSNPPTTQICQYGNNQTSGNWYGGFTMPVRKGDFWKVTQSGSFASVAISWLPLGS